MRFVFGVFLALSLFILFSQSSIDTGITGNVVLGSDGWTPWLNTDSPFDADGDIESIGTLSSAGLVCDFPSAIECRRASDRVDFSLTGDVSLCSTRLGFVCFNSRNADGCDDYEVRFYCGEKETLSSAKDLSLIATQERIIIPSSPDFISLSGRSSCTNGVCKLYTDDELNGFSINRIFSFAGLKVVLIQKGNQDFSFREHDKLTFADGSTIVITAINNDVKSNSYVLFNASGGSFAVIPTNDDALEKNCIGDPDCHPLLSLFNQEENTSLPDFFTVDVPSDDGNSYAGFEGTTLEFHVSNASNQLYDIANEAFTSPSTFDEEAFDGYIIEFTEEPVLQKLTKITPASKTTVTNAVGKNVVASHAKAVKTKHDQVKSEVVSVLSSMRGIDNHKVSSQARSQDTNTTQIKHEFSNTFNGLVMDISDEEAKAIASVEGVKRVVPDTLIFANLADSVPLIGVDDVWLLDADGNDCTSSGEDCLTGKGISIGILDTGVDYTHPDLGGCTTDEFLSGSCAKVVGGFDFADNDTNPMDDHGHGTHVAATAAGNGILKGVAPDADIYAFRVLGRSGSGSASSLIAAIERSIDLDNDGIIMEDEDDYLDIISLSLGCTSSACHPDDVMSQAIDRVVQAGVIAVISAGNSGPDEDTISSPGAARRAITVAASDKSDAVADFSSRGPVIWKNEDNIEKSLMKPDVAAPGVDICAAQWGTAWQSRECLDNEHTSISGTSMAAPHVSGAIALLLQKNNDLNPDQVKQIVKSSANDLRRKNIVQGAGRINVTRMLTTTDPLITKLDDINYMAKYDIAPTGTVFGTGLVNYTISYKLVHRLDWIVGCTEVTPVVDGALCEFGVIHLADGDYMIKLTAVRDDGSIFEDYGFFKLDNIRLDNPGSLLRSGDVLSLTGSVIGPYESYNLSYREIRGFNSFGEWQTNGIQLVRENQIEGEVGTLDTSMLEEGHYEIRLRVTYPAGHSTTETRSGIYVDPLITEGWPNEYDVLGFRIGNLILYTSLLQQPTVYDINRDGKSELIYSYGGLKVRDYQGNLMDEWENTSVPRAYTNSVVADLDGDGVVEVITTSPVTINGWFYNYLYAFNNSGVLRDGWPGRARQFSRHIAVDDIDFDGKDEIVVGCNFNKVCIFDETGLVNVISLTPGGEAIYDDHTLLPTIIEKDGEKFIAIMNVYFTDSFYRQYIEYQFGYTYLMDSDGVLLPGWPIKFEKQERVASNIVALDVDDDGEEELLQVSYNNSLYAFNFNGSLVAGFPKVLADREVDRFLNDKMIALGDLELDGSTEIIVSTHGCVHALNTTGDYLKEFPVCAVRNNTELLNSFPIIADVDDDPYHEIIIGMRSDYATNVFHGFSVFNHDGSFFLKNIGFTYFNSFVIDDLNGDGKNNLLVATKNGYLVSYDLHSRGASWPVYQANAKHTNAYKPPYDICSSCSEFHECAWDPKNPKRTVCNKLVGGVKCEALPFFCSYEGGTFTSCGEVVCDYLDEERVCNDGYDDDNDGLIDMCDDDCGECAANEVKENCQCVPTGEEEEDCVSCVAPSGCEYHQKTCSSCGSLICREGIFG